VLESILSGKGVAPDPLTSSVVDKVVFPERESEREKESFIYICVHVYRRKQRETEN